MARPMFYVVWIHHFPSTCITPFDRTARHRATLLSITFLLDVFLDCLKDPRRNVGARKFELGDEQWNFQGRDDRVRGVGDEVDVVTNIWTIGILSDSDDKIMTCLLDGKAQDVALGVHRRGTISS